MNWPRSPRWFNMALLLPTVLLVGEAGLWVHGQRQSRHALAALNQLTREAGRLNRVLPSLGEETAAAIREDKEMAEQALVAWRAAWPGGIDASTPTPAEKVNLDLYFDILAWIDRTRARAAEAQVAIRPIERFGFASLANEAPPPELAPAFWRQRQRLHYLLELLFASQPRAVLSVQREHPPLGNTADASSVRPLDTGRAAVEHPASLDADYFIPERRLMLRQSGPAGGEAFRLEFSGETPVLRGFLSRLSSGDFPVLARSVGVEPLLGAAAASEKAGIPSTHGLLPLVVPDLSRFVVVVEWLDSPPAPESPAR